MIWHITDDDEGIDDTDLRVALNLIQLHKLDIIFDITPDKCIIRMYDSGLVPRELVCEPDLLHALKKLQATPFL